MKGVFRVVGVTKDALANAQHHRPVPDHQLFKGRLCFLIAMREEPVQELCVGHGPDRSDTEEPVHLPVQSV